MSFELRDIFDFAKFSDDNFELSFGDSIGLLEQKLLFFDID